MLLLMTLTFALHSQQAMADTPRIDDPAYYTIDSYGSGSFRIKMPVYNKSGTDRWVNKGQRG